MKRKTDVSKSGVEGNMKRTQIYITTKEDECIAKDAEEYTITKSDVIRRIIDKHYSIGLTDGKNKIK